MAYALHSYKVDADGKIRVRHVFYGETKEDAERQQDKHAEICPKYGPAVHSDRTIDFLEEISALPNADILAKSEEIPGGG